MKLNRIHQDLKKLYNERGAIKLIFGSVFAGDEIEVEKCINIFRTGFWSVVPFAFETYETFGIKLCPNKKIKESSIVLGDNNGFLTFSNNLSNFIPFGQLEMLRNPKFIKYILDDWQLLEELSLPFREYTNRLDSLEFLKEYLHNKDKLKYLENSSEFYAKVYLDFWNHYYDTPQQKEYVKLMESMVNDKSYLPDFEIKDYGIWNTRAYNALAQRAYSKTNYRNVVEFEKYNFQSVIQPHGFDPVEYAFDILPHAASTTLELDGIISFFDTNPDLEWEYSNNIKEHPLFSVLEVIKKNKSTYNGGAHLEAAKAIDEELNDPVMAWDALISAGYWSGVNLGEPNIKAWKAAIDLSEKHGWTEINEVLIDQLEFYNHYKDKI